MIKTILIDDEPDALKALRLTIEKYCPEILIAGFFTSPAKGLKAIAEINPELIFLDISMPRMSGFEFLKAALPINFEIIFVTAFHQYAIEAIRFSALDYLLKPVDAEDLKSAVQRAKIRIEKKKSRFFYEAVFQNLQKNKGKIERLAVPTSEGIDFYKVEDIVCCMAEGSYTVLHFTNSTKKTISQNLKHVESLLSDSGFFRVHHGSLINLSHVLKYIKANGGSAILTNNHHIAVSRRKKEEFLKLLENC